MADLEAVRARLTAKAEAERAAAPPAVVPKRPRAVRRKHYALARVKMYPYPIHPAWKQVAELRLANPKLSSRAAAEAMGGIYSYQSIVQWVRKPEYQAFETWLLEKKLADLPPAVLASVGVLKQRFLEHAPEMQDRLLVVAETAKDPKVQAQVAQDWLDRAGGGAVRQIHHMSAHVTLTPELMHLMERRRLEAVTAEAPPGETVEGALVGAEAEWTS